MRPPHTPKLLLGFDFGRRRIGVAVGQSLGDRARALGSVRVRDGRPDWDAIAELVRSWEPGAMVVGLPRRADGTPHELEQAVERFSRQLEGRFRIPVHTVDERLSSIEGERLARGDNRAREVDAYAARVILETWLQEHA